MKKILAIFCFLLAIESIVAQVPTSGLVAEYLFSNGAYDDTNPNSYGPNNATGTSMVSNTTDRFGNANAAKSLLGIHYFETEATYITLGSNAILKPANGTISIWVKLDQINYSGWGYEYNPIILAKNTISPEPLFEGYALYLNMGGKIDALSANPATYQSIKAEGPELPSDTWRHYVITYDNTELQLYQNGVLVASTAKTYSSSGIFSNEEVVVGSSMNEIENRAFKGAVDDIRIYDRVLSEAEVQALYQESDAVMPTSYAAVSFDANAGYHQLIDDELRFQFLQDYATDQGGEVVQYTIYPWNRQNPITGSMTLQDHYNYIDINVSGLNKDSYYTLEFKANKDQKYVLKFKTKE